MNTKLFAFALLTLAFSCMQTFALDIRDEGPTGKNWKKVTSTHYINTKTIKKVKPGMYQIDFANSVQGASWWNYFTERIDCSSSMTWARGSGSTEWVGPLTPSDFHKAAAEFVCKERQKK